MYYIIITLIIILCINYLLHLLHSRAITPETTSIVLVNNEPITASTIFIYQIHYRRMNLMGQSNMGLLKVAATAF